MGVLCVRAGRPVVAALGGHPGVSAVCVREPPPMRRPQLLGPHENRRFRSLTRQMIYVGWCVRLVSWRRDVRALLRELLPVNASHWWAFEDRSHR